MTFINWWETEETMRAHSRGMSAQNAWKPGDRCPRCGSDHLTTVIASSGSIFGQVERLICLASECSWKEEKMVSERYDDGETCRRIDRARAGRMDHTKMALDMRPYLFPGERIFARYNDGETSRHMANACAGVINHTKAVLGMRLQPYQGGFSATVIKIGKKGITLSVTPRDGWMLLSFSAFDAMKFCPEKKTS